MVDKWEFHQRSTVLVPMAFLALFTLFVPSCSNLTPLCLVIAVQGICSGWIDNACQVLCIRFKGADGVNVSPYLQGLHFFFALGAVISPFIFAGFLGTNALVAPNSDVEGDFTDNTQQAYNKTDSASSIEATTLAISVASSSYAGGFYVIFALIMPGVLGLIYYVFFKPDTFEIDASDIRHCVTLQPGGLARGEGHHGEKHAEIKHGRAMGEVELAHSEQHEEAKEQEALEHRDVQLEDPFAPSGVREDGEYDAAPSSVPAPAPSVAPRHHANLIVEGDGRHGFSGFTGTVVSALPHLSALGFIMVFCVSMVLFFYAGIENYSNFIFTYAFSITRYNAATSAVINSMFWIAFAVGRALAVPLSHYWSPTKMLLYTLATCLFWMFVLIFAPNSGGFFW